MQQLYYVVILLLVLVNIGRCCKCKQCKRFVPEPHCITYTPSGIFRGSYNTTRLGRRFESYRGIKYAAPPIGDLRFQPPKPIYNYRGVVDATKDGPVCPQALTTGLLSIMDEDCLTINVYTPKKPVRTHLLPVIVYIHQGAFYLHGARSDIYGPNYLLDRNIVLVTFNYRLGSLGFISTADKIAPGNNGLKDQVIALRWVQRNIAAFGGDPNCVTLTGYSSGATSIVGHLVSPMSKGLFHRAIAMSGSPTTLGKTPTDLYNYTVKQAVLVNCPTDNSTVIIECLKTKHWIEIANTYNKFFIFAENPHHIWEPIVEKDYGQERFLTMDPIDAIKGGKMYNIPFVVSQNEGEYFPFAYPIVQNDTLLREFNENWDTMAPIAFLLPEQNVTTALSVLRSAYIQNETLRNDEVSIDRLGTLFGDSIVAYPVNRLVNLLCRHSPKPVWYLYFTYVGNYSFFTDPVTRKPSRAVHQDETIYLFHQPHDFPMIGDTGGDARTLDRLTSIWYNFAKHGHPNPKGNAQELKGLVWPPMTPNNRTYLQLSNDLTLHQNLKEDRLQIWEQLYPIQY